MGSVLTDGLIINKGFLRTNGNRIVDGDVLWSNNHFHADGLSISDDPLISDAVHISESLNNFRRVDRLRHFDEGWR